MMLRATLLLLGAGSLFAQQQAIHTFTPSDIEQGGQLYRGDCASCHGQNGDQVTGIDLGHTRYRTPLDDDQVAQIILKGIPGTQMPAHADLTPFQAATIVGYLHSMASDSTRLVTAGLTGNPANGKALFFGQEGCTNCHRVNGTGSHFAPDLSEIGGSRTPAQLEDSILNPSAEFSPQGHIYRVVAKNGTETIGRLLNEDTYSVQMIDRKERLLSFQKSDLRDYDFVTKSPMPSFKTRMSNQDLADVVSYLESLQPAPGTVAAGRGGRGARR